MDNAKSINAFFARPTNFKDQLFTLREIVLRTGMKETLKWGIPVYMAHGKNIVGISSFKFYFGLWIYQGALLTDPSGVLMNAQEGKTVAMRQWRFAEGDPIDETLILKYLQEAIEHAKAGREIKPEKAKPIVIPAELKRAFQQDGLLKHQFDALSTSCRREYAEYIGEAKREETRLRRLEKSIAMIREKKGLHDQYK